jgi:putative spermidine/putrescine transport system substrate-binding protein
MLSRRTTLALGAGGLAAAARPAKAAPVGITILDVGGALQLMQPAFEAFRAANPTLVSRITFSKAPAPELAAKLRAQQQAGRVDIDLVLTGSDGLASGLELQQWQRLLPEHQADLPDFDAIYEPAALNLFRAQGQGFGVVMNYYPSGPLLEYLPDKVPAPPATAAALLDWARAHPDRFMYARPANSGPGRTFMMALPYLLGDTDPKDPVHGWDRTWAYLDALNPFIEYYPSGTGATMKELGEGSRDMIVTTTGWDINPRALGIVPKEARIGTLEGFHWVCDGFFMAVPKGVPPDRLSAVLAMMRYVLEPAQQAISYDDGYLYPGPAVKNVPLSMAPARSQAVIAEFGRPEYASLIVSHPIELPLTTDRMVLAFRLWDERIGGKKGTR